MAKKSLKKNSRKKNYLAFDLGGTKIFAAVVSADGDILSQEKEYVYLDRGPKGLIEQMARLGKRISAGIPIAACGIGSAGPLDPVRGLLLNPTNLKTKGKRWGVVSIVKDLKKKLRCPVYLENDAACTVLGEAWAGRGEGCQNVVAVTLGTGLGVGAICNGTLIRGGRGLHTEFGHIIMDTSPGAPLCGCGNYGCAEAILSGVNFTKSVARRWGEDHLTGEELVRRARNGDELAVDEFQFYGKRLAEFFVSLIVVFSPEKILISGGFSSSYDLFQEPLKDKLSELMKTRRTGIDLQPKIFVSNLSDYAGVLGAAKVALNIA